MEDITKVQVFFLSIICRAGTVHDKAGEMDIVSSALRVAVCKDRESVVSDPFGESLIFCPKVALGRLFSKIIFKSSNDFVYLGNLRKIKSAVKMRSKCGFLVD